jgi:hypothetical protein
VLVARVAPQLLAETGRGVITAAKLIGEIAGVDRFTATRNSLALPDARPSPSPQAAPTATAWTAAATGGSTTPSTCSPSADIERLMAITTRHGAEML